MPKRLVVELHDRVAEILDDRVTRESLNKTTIVNRAVQVYGFLADAQDEGRAVFVQDGDKLERVHFI